MPTSRTPDHITLPKPEFEQLLETAAEKGAKRALIESAGRKEIAMLVPLVFMILPLSVLFAVFPGILMLRLGVG